ncbi:MAG TPA: DUF3830 family protein [Gaiellaceae bacterium]|nr:DUF3830 family protein [Gaiellaceae bacterium]
MRYIEIAYEQRGVSCVARLLDEDAPLTCEAVWNALPLTGEVFHAKYARNEVYILVPSFATAEVPPENTTITPIPGDVVYFGFEPWQLAASSHGYSGTERPDSANVVDMAVFYGRNNLLLNPDFGFVPGSVYAAIEEGLEAFADASREIWRNGGANERMIYRRQPH